jgi:hypothetical protein
MVAYKIAGNKELGKALLKIAYSKNYSRRFMRQPDPFEIFDEYDHWIIIEGDKDLTFGNPQFTPSHQCNLLDFIAAIK